MVSSESHSIPDPLDESLLSQAEFSSASDALRSLCARFTPTFVAVQRRDARLEECLGTLRTRLDSASEGAEFAEQRLEVGSKAGDERQNITEGGFVAPSLRSLAERHRLRRRTLLQHSSLLELLELPALMDACLRAGLYDESLAIAAFGNALQRRHSVNFPHPGAEGYLGKNGAGNSEVLTEKRYDLQESNQKDGGEEVILSVVSSLRSREQDLRHHLLTRLRGGITMPHCLEIVTALRRLNGIELERKRSDKAYGQDRDKGKPKQKQIDLEQAHSAMELRLMVEFFEARDSWLRDSAPIGPSSLAGPDANDILSVGGEGADSELLLNNIDAIRTRTFEVATQFIAIFCGASSQATLSQDQSLHLLSMWLTRRVQYFLSSLKVQLVLVKDAAVLRDVLDATNFFASSMGRVGSDFQCLLAPIFEERLSDIVIKCWSDGVEALDVTLEVCRDAGMAGPLMSTASTSNVLEGYDVSSVNSFQGGFCETGTPSPPRRLLASPPLARFVNAFLDGLNEARRCLLAGTFELLRSSSFHILEQVDDMLQANERAVLTPGLRGEALRLRDAASQMRTGWIDGKEYCTLALEVAFGNVENKIKEVDAIEKGEEKKKAVKLEEKSFGVEDEDGVKESIS